eukprot:INCI17625.3.p1 GENE.INCI17625.3~~INCI17625.3.p1  ORF type:complete len:1625 (-),score=210.65 INCI17625.3:693-5567(-)
MTDGREGDATVRALSSRFFTVASCAVSNSSSSNNDSDAPKSPGEAPPHHGGAGNLTLSTALAGERPSSRAVLPPASNSQHAAKLRKVIPVLDRQHGGSDRLETRFWVPSHRDSLIQLPGSYQHERVQYRSDKMIARVKIVEVFESAKQAGQIPSKLIADTLAEGFRDLENEITKVAKVGLPALLGCLEAIFDCNHSSVSTSASPHRGGRGSLRTSLSPSRRHRRHHHHKSVQFLSTTTAAEVLLDRQEATSPRVSTYLAAAIDTSNASVHIDSKESHEPRSLSKLPTIHGSSHRSKSASPRRNSHRYARSLPHKHHPGSGVRSSISRRPATASALSTGDIKPMSPTTLFSLTVEKLAARESKNTERHVRTGHDCLPVRERPATTGTTRQTVCVKQPLPQFVDSSVIDGQNTDAHPPTSNNSADISLPSVESRAQTRLFRGFSSPDLIRTSVSTVTIRPHPHGAFASDSEAQNVSSSDRTRAAKFQRRAVRLRWRIYSNHQAFFDIKRMASLELDKGTSMSPWVVAKQASMIQSRQREQRAVLVCMRAWSTDLQMSCFRRLRSHAARARSLARLSTFIGHKRKGHNAPRRYYFERWVRNHVLSRRARHAKDQELRAEAIQAKRRAIEASKAKIANLQKQCEFARANEEQVEGLVEQKVEELQDPTSIQNFSTSVATILMQSLNSFLDILAHAVDDQLRPALGAREKQYASFANFSTTNLFTKQYLDEGVALDREILRVAYNYDIEAHPFAGSSSPATARTRSIPSQHQQQPPQQLSRSQTRTALVAWGQRGMPVQSTALSARRQHSKHSSDSKRHGEDGYGDNDNTTIFADPWHHDLGQKLMMWMNYRVSVDPRRVAKGQTHITTGSGKEHHEHLGLEPELTVSTEWLHAHPSELDDWHLHDRVVNASLPVSMLQWPRFEERQDSRYRCRRIIKQGSKPRNAIGSFMMYFDPSQGANLSGDRDLPEGDSSSIATARRLAHQVLSTRCSHSNSKAEAAAVAAVTLPSNENEPAPKQVTQSSQPSMMPPLLFQNDRNTIFRIQPETLARRLHFAFFAQLMTEYPRLQMTDADRAHHDKDFAGLATAIEASAALRAQVRRLSHNNPSLAVSIKRGIKDLVFATRGAVARYLQLIREHMEWTRYLADVAGLCWNYLNPLILCDQVNESELDFAELVSAADHDVRAPDNGTTKEIAKGKLTNVPAVTSAATAIPKSVRIATTSKSPASQGSSVGFENDRSETADCIDLDTDSGKRRTTVYHSPEMIEDEFEHLARALAQGASAAVHPEVIVSFSRFCVMRTSLKATCHSDAVCPTEQELRWEYCLVCSVLHKFYPLLRDVFAFFASTSEMGGYNSAWAVDLPRFKKFLMQNRILLSVAELLSKPLHPDENATGGHTAEHDQGLTKDKGLRRSFSARNPLGERKRAWSIGTMRRVPAARTHAEWIFLEAAGGAWVDEQPGAPRLATHVQLTESEFFGTLPHLAILATNTSSDYPVHLCLEKLIRSHILHCSTRLGLGTINDQVASTYSIRHVMQQHHKILHSIFMAYAKHHAPGEGGLSPLPLSSPWELEFGSFRRLLADTDTLGWQLTPYMAKVRVLIFNYEHLFCVLAIAVPIADCFCDCWFLWCIVRH